MNNWQSLKQLAAKKVMVSPILHESEKRGIKYPSKINLTILLGYLNGFLSVINTNRKPRNIKIE